jgi:hypothetical protein
MRSKLLPLLVANLFAAAGAFAADDENKEKKDTEIYGSVSVGVQGGSLNAPGETNSAKVREYRDIGSGVVGKTLSEIDLTGRDDDGYFKFFGENLGYPDQYMTLKGAQYGSFKYQLYENDIVHNWTQGAISPFSGIGGTTLTAPLPNTNTSTWNTFDYGMRRQNIGGNIEVTKNSPWYFRVEANQVKDTGLKWTAGSNGTSPGNGFTEKPFPLDFTTRNLTLEGGYSTKQSRVSVALLTSDFSNGNDLQRWTNNFFGNQLDTTTLPSDSRYLKGSINANYKGLPLDSTVAARLTQSRTTNTLSVLTSMPTGTTPNAVNDATNPSASNFDGAVTHRTASVAVYSNPNKATDSRVYWNWFQKHNDSTAISFNPAAGSNLQCDGGACTPTQLNYKKNNLGADVGYRFDPGNRVVVGYDYVDLNRNRDDYDETKDNKLSLEWRNTSLESLSSRFKYQHMQRRSNFLQGNVGVDANDPLFLQRYVAKFDAANVDQDALRLTLDWVPAEMWDMGFEGILKKNKFKDTTLGRTKDDRQELYFSLGYGDIKTFRVFAFADVEFVSYDSTHRNISTVSSGAGAPPNDTPSGNCQSTFPNCYDPINTTANSSNYNWNSTNKDRNLVLGIGADWVPMERWKLQGSIMSEKTNGTVDFSVQPPANPSTPVVPISNYDNANKFSINLKGTYAYTRQIDLMAGYSFERFRFDDISYTGYQYTTGSGTSTSYLTGLNAFPNYTTNLAWVGAKARF